MISKLFSGKPIPMVTRKTAFVLGLLLTAGVSQTWAERGAHRPWFSQARPLEDREADALASKPRGAFAATHARRTKVAHKPYGRKTQDAPATSTGQKVVQQAMKYKGTKYVFGGTTKKGIDCSGFVMRVYHDVKSWQLPRTSAAMYDKSHPIRSSELRPGDLVFFKNTYKRGISHVGIYTGNNKFIHARGKKWGVTVNALSDPYYQLHYAGARRIY